MISDETIVEHHPWVEDSSKEMERLKKLVEENMGDLPDMFPKK